MAGEGWWETRSFIPYGGANLDRIFSQQHERMVAHDNTVRFENLTFQIASQTFRYSLTRCPVLVCRHLDHSFSVYYGQHLLGRYDPKGGPLISAAAILPRKKQIA